MELPADANDVQTSHEPQVPADNAERIDQVLEKSPEPQIVAEDEEMANQSVEKSPEVQNSEQVAQISSEPQIETEEVVTRPSLESVWESLQAAEASQASSFELRDTAQQKGGVSEGSQISPEVQSKPESTGRKPSALRTRPSTRAKRSVTFEDDFEKPGESQVQKSGIRRQAGERHLKFLPGCLGLFLSVALASLVVYVSTPNIPTKPRLWTSAELEVHNGTNNKPPLLLSILGSVFDVSKGWKHYGPGGSYHHFVGRDASRAFVSGNFTDDGLIDSLEGLTSSQIKAIDDWRLFFVSRYIYLGKLVGTFYNKDGLPTKKLHIAQKKIKQAAEFEKQQKLDEEQFPNCSSRWAQDEGGEVWCDDGKYPRIIELITQGPKMGPPRTRCACLEGEELQRPGVTGYDACDPQSSKCNA
ncbi:membrane-associated progesterone-binding protein 4 [Physcomitrium patens]|uniref:Cytochrome b5 heme-binding domain-containing protein n=1 Tax=Physcomitrium patens TaxID=3218 RepID=A0A2K1J1S9_PHYPA|nr:membrane-associated progesterone-binding protein 4-like [Physcomitrium patens]PNR35480.1 hypothetical protein PHYPA_023380 [Physcomitrium patens]|eukprot:XP_024403226.1 membrane-associated progesterone-binding protein 4-like [Physcomitrella patens]